MKPLLFILLILVFMSCKSEVTEENFDFGAWIEENRTPQHEKLISVIGEEVGFDECDTDIDSGLSNLFFTKEKDTISVSYCIEKVSYLGRSLYNIDIRNDTVFILFDEVYNPYQTEFIDGEVIIINYNYKILNNDGRFDNKKWIVSYGTLVDEKAYKKLKSDAEK